MKRSRKKLMLDEDEKDTTTDSEHKSLYYSMQKLNKKRYNIVSSPSTGKQFTLLGSSTPTPLSNDNSECSSLNELNVSNLIRLEDGSLDPTRYDMYLTTPPGKLKTTVILTTASPSPSTSTLHNIDLRQTDESDFSRTLKAVSKTSVQNTDGNILINHNVYESDEDIFDFPKNYSDKNRIVETELDELSTPNKKINFSDAKLNKIHIIKNASKDSEGDENVAEISVFKSSDAEGSSRNKSALNKSNEDTEDENYNLKENTTKQFSQDRSTNERIPFKQNIRVEFENEVENEKSDANTNSDIDSDSLSTTDGSSTFDEIYEYDSGSESSMTESTQSNDDGVIMRRNESIEDGHWINISDYNTGFIHYTRKYESKIHSDIKTPLEFYQQFVGDEVIMKMVSESNKYAEEYIRTNDLKRKSRLKKWIPTTFEEMKVFMGVLLLMGITKTPALVNYWSKKKCYRNDFIANLMPRDLFLLLLKFWHFSEQITGPTEDKLHKIRDVLNILQKKISEMLKPGKFLVIDETMIPWRGRLKFRQYIKNKAHRYGIKLYKLCTPEGYTYSILVYTGKSDEKTGAGHGHDIVMQLTRNLLDEGRILIADNFYTSVRLAEDLLKRKTSLCGTLRTNRKLLPKDFMKKKIKKGEVVGKMNENGVKIIRWVDKRAVTMITTCREHKATLKDTGKKSRYTNKSVMKPAAVIMYNENKKGVDFSDQMIAYYSTLKKGLKWYRKVMMCLLFGTCLINAWLLHSSVNEKEEKMTLLLFTESVIQEITGVPFIDPPKESKRRIHTLIKKDKFKRCTSCYKELRARYNAEDAGKKSKKVRTFCEECEKAMCLECYNKVHNV